MLLKYVDWNYVHFVGVKFMIDIFKLYVFYFLFIKKVRIWLDMDIMYFLRFFKEGFFGRKFLKKMVGC